MRILGAILFSVALGVPGIVQAQEDTSPKSGESAPAPSASAEAVLPAASQPAAFKAADGTIVIPKLTPIVIQIVDPVGSLASKSLDTFTIRLAEPIVLGDGIVIPAGVSGKGEVVHAKKAGGSGAPGELVLAARYLEVDGRQMRLRSLHVSPSGQSKIRTVNDINIAAAATVPLVSVVGYFMKGGEVDVPAGALADAKVAQDFILAAPVVLPAAETGAASASEPASIEIQPEGKQDNEEQ